MSILSKKEEIKNRLRKSRENEDNEIFLTTEKIKNITIGMDIFKIELDKLKEAPSDWNFYTPLNDYKMGDLIESIVDNGLLNPIIIWEQNDGYMILAGHNRVRAYKMLFSQTGDDKYSKIYAYIKKKNEINEDEARSIIIDTNFVQRQLTTAEKTKSIVIKYNQLGRRRRNSGGHTTASIIAKQYDLKERQIYNYYKLDSLIKEFMDMIDIGDLSIKSGLKLSSLDKDFQIELYNNYKDILDNKKIISLKVNTSKEDIINQIENSIFEYVSITLKVPVGLEKEFKVYVNKWLKENIK